AEAGLRRMEWSDQIAGVLSIEEMLPAPAQGALAVEARVDDEQTIALLYKIHDSETAIGVRAERAFLAAMEGGCQVPIAAYAVVENSRILLHGLLANLDGSRCIREALSGSDDDPVSVGDALAELILKKGGREIMDSLKQY
ncbi:MAG: hydroxymethylbilane synthase, partial [Candidatus Hinthialibacter sp.]